MKPLPLLFLASLIWCAVSVGVDGAQHNFGLALLLGATAALVVVLAVIFTTSNPKG